MKGPNGNWTASASSIHLGTYFPRYAIDGRIVSSTTGFFHNNEHTTYGWFQLDLGKDYYVRAVEVFHRLDNQFYAQAMHKEVLLLSTETKTIGLCSIIFCSRYELGRRL